MVTPVIKLLL